MRSKITTILLILFLLFGIGLVAYPTVSDKWNQAHQSRAISAYDSSVESLTPADYSRMLLRAQQYNDKLPVGYGSREISQEQRNEYESLLNPIGTGMMGTLYIEKIDCKLPIYHGTQQEVLQKAIGHLEWSSLPVGGKSSHCVVSGHRGLTSAKLLTRLDEMAIGDEFEMHVLNDVYRYRVDQIVTVLPEEVDELRIFENKDYCTLITCTPYGLNTHRLLVRGIRVKESDSTGDLIQYDNNFFDQTFWIAVIIGGVLILIIIILVIVFLKKRC